MLKIFNTHLAFIPVAIIICFIVLLRLDVYYSDFYIDFWSNTDLSPFSKLYVFIIGKTLVQNKLFNLVFSGIIVFVLSAMISSVLVPYKIKNLSFLPAWIFVVVLHMFPAFTFVSPQLFSLIFILFAFKNIISYTEKTKNSKSIFNIGLLIGIATMFWSPSIIFVLFVFYFLDVKLKLNIKTVISLLLMITIPIIYVLAYLILTDNSISFSMLFKSLSLNRFDFTTWSADQFFSSTVLFFVSVTSVYYVYEFLTKQLKAVKQLFALLFFFCFNIILVLFFQNENNVSILLFFSFPLAIFISIYFNRIKRNVLAEFIHLALLLSIIINFMNFT